MRFLLLVVVLFVALCLNGCDNQTHADVVVSKASGVEMRPSPATDPGDAVGIATALLRDQGFIETDYPIAGARFDDEQGEWHITFPHQPMRHDFDEILVVVDDVDQSARFVNE